MHIYKPKPGDWVSFYNGADKRVSVGVVSYTGTERYWPHKVILYTDVGIVNEDQVLEVRTQS